MSFALGRPVGHDVQPRNLTRSALVSHGATRRPVTGAPTSSRPSDAPTEPPPPDPRPRKLFDQVRVACRLKHLSDRTENACDEARLVLAHLHAAPRLIALLLYGADLRPGFADDRRGDRRGRCGEVWARWWGR